MSGNVVAGPWGDSTESPALAPELVVAPVAELVAHPDNPRRDLGDVGELAASIRAHGVLEPLIVVPVEAFNAAAGPQLVVAPEAVRWVVVAGHRRHAAAALAGAATVPVLLRPDLADPVAALEVMVVENVQRSALAPLEEARAFARLREAGRSQRDIAARVGCGQSHVSKRLALLELPAAAQAAVETGRLQLADAAELAKLRKHPERLAGVLEYALDDRFAAVDVPGRVGSELYQIERAEELRRVLAPAAERGARLLNTDAGELPRDFMRRLIGEPDRIDAAAAAGTLAAYLTGTGSICYLDLADPIPDEPTAAGGQDDDAAGPDVVSSGGITVRRVDPAPPATDRPAGDEARAALAAVRQAVDPQRQQREAAELARDEVCQRLVAGFAADPGTAVPWLAGHVLRDQADDWYPAERAQGWLAAAGLAVYEEGEEPGVYAWLQRTADPAAAVLVAATLAVAAAERRLILRGQYSADGWDIHDLIYLDRLAAAGHVLSDWERHRAAQVDTACPGTDEGCGLPYGHPGDCDPGDGRAAAGDTDGGERV